MNKRIASLLATVAIAGGGVLLSGGTAQAYTPDSYCGVGYGNGDACFYYLTNWSGSMVGVEDHSITDVENPWITFVTSGSGQGTGIGNAAGSELNGDLNDNLIIYIHVNHTGASDFLTAGEGIEHGGGVTINNERSYWFALP